VTRLILRDRRTRGGAQVALRADGRRLAHLDSQGTLHLWDLKTEQILRSFKLHGNAARCRAFHPDGRRLVSGGSDGTVRLWDLDHGQEARTLTPSRVQVGPRVLVAVSPDGRFLVGAGYGTAAVWDAPGWQSGAGPGPLVLPEDYSRLHSALAMAFAPDSRRLLAATDGGLCLLELAADGRPAAPLVLFTEPRGQVDAVAWAPDGRQLAFAEGHTLGLLGPDAPPAPDSCLPTRVKQTKPIPLVEHTRGIRCLAFSPDGRRLAWGDEDGTVQVRDPAGVAAAATFRAHEGGVAALAFSPDGGWLASAGAGPTVKLWDLAARGPGAPPVRRLEGHTGRHVNGVAFAPDGRRLASAGSDRTVRVWDLGTDQEVLLLRLPALEPSSVAFTPDGRHLVAEAETLIHVWDAAPPGP
jgi:WD40 repeat protein